MTGGPQLPFAPKVGSRGRGSRARPVPERPSLLAVLRLYRAVALVDRFLSPQLAGIGFNATRWHALTVLHHAKTALTMSELGDRLAVRPANLSGVVKILGRRGFAARRANVSDRRSAYVSITPRGRTFMKRRLPAHYAALEKTMSGLSDPERRRLADLLGRVAMPRNEAAGRIN